MPTPVEEIKQKLDIVDIVGEYIKLTPAGTNHKARCPFHNEKSPSFMVSRDKQIYHCFGCGKGGDMFSFVMEMEGLDFPEALRLLAKKANVELKAVDPTLQTKRTKLFDVLKAAAAFYHDILLKSQNVQKARDYLTERGITAEQIEQFQLGYSSTAWDTLYLYLKQKGFSDEHIFDAGLVVQKSRGGYYDRFRGRVIFPIHDTNGNVVGFGGRILEQAEGETERAKYINSPQTLVYDKSRIAYGLWFAKQAIREKKEIIIVEGYMDVLASHRGGVANVIASSGTALTESQLDTLKRHSMKLLFCFDQDAAGAQAARRGIELALARGFEVLMITLPFGKDPDEVVRKQPDAWQTAVAQAKPFVEYYFERVRQQQDLTTVEGKKAAARELLPLINHLVDPVEQTHFLQQLGGLIRVDESILRTQLNKQTTVGAVSVAPAQTPTAAPSAPINERETKMLQLIIAILNIYPDLVPQAAGQFEFGTLADTPILNLYKMISLYYSENQRFTVSDFGQHLEATAPTLVEPWQICALLAEKEIRDLDEDAAERELTIMVRELQRITIRRQLASLTAELAQLEREAGSDEETTQLIARFNQLTKALKNIS